MCLDKWSAAPWSDENGGLATFPKDKKKERGEMIEVPEWSIPSFLSILAESEFESVQSSPHKTNVFCG